MGSMHIHVYEDSHNIAPIFRKNVTFVNTHIIDETFMLYDTIWMPDGLYDILYILYLHSSK